MKEVFLLGAPVKHSLSQSLHNAAFKELNLPFAYKVRETPTDKLSEAMQSLRATTVAGANITTPHKSAALPHMDGLVGEARLTKSVNTVVNSEGRLEGHTTDGVGALRALEEKTSLHGSHALVLGAGGAGRAVALALVNAGCARVELLDVREKRARMLLSRLPAEKKRVLRPGKPSRHRLETGMAQAEILVNCTPVGMQEGKGAPLPLSLVRAEHVVLEAVYARQTELARHAKAAGCVFVDGTRMLLHQAAESFALWTGKEAPLQAMESALEEAMR